MRQYLIPSTSWQPTRSGWLLALLLIGLVKISLHAQDLQPDHTTAERLRSAIHRLDDGRVELELQGVIIDASGKPATDATLQLVDYPNPLDNRPQQRKVEVRNGRFRVRTEGLNGAYLLASNSDGSMQAFVTIAKHEVTKSASSDIRVQLQPSRLVAIRVVDEGVPVKAVDVLLRLGWSAYVQGKTDARGIAKLRIPKGQDPSSVRAWTKEGKRIGCVDFRNHSRHDLRKPLHEVELMPTKPLAIRMRFEDGSPFAEQPIRLGVRGNEYGWMIDRDLFEGVTNAKGEATFPWYPDWDGRHFVYADETRFYIDETNSEGEVLECSVKRHAELQRHSFKLPLPDRCEGGMLVEGWSFQNHQESRSTVFFSRADSDGVFDADVVPGYTYNFFVNDYRWVSRPVAAILVNEQGENTFPETDVVRGTPVEIALTAGPDRIPVTNQFVHLETPHDFQWKEGGETQHGSGGRRWWGISDSDGLVHARAYPGEFEARTSDGSSHVEQSATLVAGQTNKLVLHRELLGPTIITGQVLITSTEESLGQGTTAQDGTGEQGSQLPFAVEVQISQADSSFIKPDVVVQADEAGRFEAEVESSRAMIYAIAADKSYSGFQLVRTIEKDFEIELRKTGRMSGVVLDEEGNPIVGGDVFASARVDAKDNPNNGQFTARSHSVVRLRTKTDEKGAFEFRGLPAEVKTMVGMDTDHITPNTFRHLATVYLKPGEARLDQQFHPRKRSSSSVDAEDRFSKLLRDCDLIHTHGLVVLSGKGADCERLRTGLLDTRDVPDVGWYLPYLLSHEKIHEDQTVRKLIDRRQWPMPLENQLWLIAINAQGDELGRLELDMKAGDSEEQLFQQGADFLKEHRIAQENAREKLESALAEANASNRRVWAVVGQTRCAPCITFADWLDRYSPLISKAFVVVKIDNIRDQDGGDISGQLMQEGGIPWHVMLDGKGEILVTSKADIGNIGSPDNTIESKRHVRKMLESGAGDRLTEEEIDILLDSIR